jgi:YgiT-type zinc finger domain-containing protein
LQSQIVSVNFERDGAWLVVQNVPALVCDGCRKRYFDDEITRQLLAFELEQRVAPITDASS